MNEQNLQELWDAVNSYTSFFFFLIAVSFAAFIVLILALIHHVKNVASLKENRSLLAETVLIQEEERRRIGQELHDSVSQNIKTLVLLQKELAAGCYDESLKKQIEKIISLENKNQKQLRSIIYNLTIPALENVPFKTLIADLCEQFQEKSGIHCSFFVASDVPLDSFSKEQKHHILRIIQEALNNAQIHASAEETSVVIRKIIEKQESGQFCKIRIMIFDDGTGFDTKINKKDSATDYFSKSTTHFGMSGMEMRAKLLDGTLTVQRAPESGTEVRLELPLDEKSAQ